MSDAGQEAARRWPGIGRGQEREKLDRAMRGGFVAGAEWQAGQGAEAKLGRIRAFAEKGAKVSDPALAASVGYAECARNFFGSLRGKHEQLWRPGRPADL